MNRAAAAIAATIFLAACNTNIDPNVATPNQIVIAANAFNAAEITATNYLHLPLCGATAATLCRTAALTKTVVSAVRTGYQARNQILADLQSNVTVPVTLFQTLVTAVSVMQSLNAQQ